MKISCGGAVAISIKFLSFAFKWLCVIEIWKNNFLTWTFTSTFISVSSYVVGKSAVELRQSVLTLLLASDFVSEIKWIMHAEHTKHLIPNININQVAVIRFCSHKVPRSCGVNLCKVFQSSSQTIAMIFLNKICLLHTKKTYINYPRNTKIGFYTDIFFLLNAWFTAELTIEVSSNMRAGSKLFLHNLLIVLPVLQGRHMKNLLLSWCRATRCVDTSAHCTGVGWNCT